MADSKDIDDLKELISKAKNDNDRERVVLSLMETSATKGFSDFFEKQDGFDEFMMSFIGCMSKHTAVAKSIKDIENESSESDDE